MNVEDVKILATDFVNEFESGEWLVAPKGMMPTIPTLQRLEALFTLYAAKLIGEQKPKFEVGRYHAAWRDGLLIGVVLGVAFSFVIFGLTHLKAGL